MNVFTCGEIVINDDSIIGGVNYSLTVNPTTELQLGVLAKASAEFSMLDMDLNEYDLVGESFTYEKDNELIGCFIVQEVEKKDDTKYNITMYDNAVMFDESADEWLQEQKYPVTVGQMISNVCDYLGVDLIIEDETNSDYEIYNNSLVSGSTFADVIGWATDIMCNFGVINASGSLVIKFYEDVGSSIDRDCYTTQTMSDNITDVIDKFQIKTTDDDIGTIIGDGTNCYIISDNPFLYGESIENLTAIGETLLEKLSSFQYYPLNVEGYFDIDVGEIFEITTSRGTFKSIAMERSFSSSGILQNVISTGNQQRTEVTAVNKMVKALNNKTNEIRADIDEFSVKLTATETSIENLTTITEENSSEIKTTATEIMLEVENNYVSSEGFEETVTNTVTSTVDALTINFQNSIDDLEGNQTLLNEYIRFIGAKMELGKSGNDFTAELDNERLAFLQLGAAVAYLSNKKLYVTEGEFITSLQIGSNYKWAPRDNGNLSLVYVGGDE